MESNSSPGTRHDAAAYLPMPRGVLASEMPSLAFQRFSGSMLGGCQLMSAMVSCDEFCGVQVGSRSVLWCARLP